MAERAETNEPHAGLSVPRLFVVVCLLTVLVCALFAGGSSAGILVQILAFRVREDGGFLLRLAIKAGFFGFVVLADAWAIYRVTRRWPAARAAALSPISLGRREAAAVALVLVFTAALVFVRLDRYPGAAPDETYHLVFARNIAVHGQYAYGHPDAEMLPFDDYASVGPAVLLPVAAAIRWAGVSLTAARVPLGLALLALCLALHGCLRRVLGAGASAAGAALMVAGMGSVYLGRSLYGEVPALLYMVLGLLCWRRALARPGFTAWGLLAGAGLGLALLSKLFVVMALPAVLGALAFDRLTHCRVRWVHVIAPVCGLAVVAGAWVLAQSLYGDPDAHEATVATTFVHRDHLLFGLSPVPATLGFLLGRMPVTVVVSIAALLFVARRVFLERYDPATVTLYLIAPLFVFWWLFFSTGRHPRYLWYACALAGAFSGPLVLAAARGALARGKALRGRLAWGLVLCLLLGPPALRAHEQVVHVFLVDETRDDLALASFTRALPEDLRVATTYWPAERTLNFLADRPVTRIFDFAGEAAAYDVVIVDLDTQSGMLDGAVPERRFGRYGVMARGDVQGGLP